MNQTKTIFGCLVVAIALSASCTRKASDEIDFGTINGSVYENRYFGLALALPPEWSIQDEAARQNLLDLGGRMVAGDDNNLKAAVRASEMTSVTLFAAFKHPVGAPVPFNPSVMSIAERVRDMPGIKRGKDYLFHMKRALESSQMQIAFPRDITTTSIGGKDFDVMYMELPIVGITVRQKCFASVMKGYALVITASFVTDEEEDVLQGVLGTVTFTDD